jgi:hypothetical protein
MVANAFSVEDGAARDESFLTAKIAKKNWVRANGGLLVPSELCAALANYAVQCCVSSVVPCLCGGRSDRQVSRPRCPWALASS